jgi:APA family basic amino acid/polyamine antiporter
MAKLLIRKSLPRLLKEAEDPADDSHGITLRRHLTGWHLIMLGIGAIIGAGIFSLSGLGAANYAGPGIVYSFIVAGVLCAFAGVCYAEMASMVPLAGSAYTYSYATMGEFIAWIIGWDLVLEYTFGAVTVASSWSGYLVSLLTKTLGVELGTAVMRLTKGPWELVTLADGSQIHGIWNVPASFIGLLVASILYRGIRESATINNFIVVVKVAIVVAFIALGWAVIDQANWIADHSATGFWALIPPVKALVKDGVEVLQFGWTGVLTGAGVVLFSYIGF